MAIRSTPRRRNPMAHAVDVRAKLCHRPWLSLGRNLGFIGATAMVADCHSPAERGRARGANDFVVFGTVACASFFAVSLLHTSGWTTVNWLVLPAVAFILVPLFWRAAVLPRSSIQSRRG
ncbi:hypothetical protein [Rhizobium hidalgonense]|uniref:hypothetical protein n=1 Tax=Rhizobium hidalgonense TaxID=1538159 RepID=UPI0035C66F7C